MLGIDSIKGRKDQRMTTIVGILCKDGAVLSSDKRASKGFFIGSKITQKILKVDDTLAVAIAGQVSDAEYLVNAVRAERQLVTLQRGFALTVKETSKLISNVAYQGMRSYQPYYAEFIVAGVDALGPHVYVTDMSGAVSSEDFVSSGSGSPIAYGVLESNYKKNMTLKEAEALGTNAVQAAMERDPGSGNGIDVVAIPVLLQAPELKSK
jgi:proteasome beta subunit